MKKLLGLIFNRWVLAAVLLLAMALVIWIVGPLVSVANRTPLESETARWITIAIVALLFVLRLLWVSWRARRGNATVVKALLTPAPGAARAEAESPDLMAVRQRFESAMQLLRETRFGAGGRLTGWRAKLDGRYLYELPWYMIIGAPGSGKTTALQNCGLNFPLASRLGDQALHGVAGTRHCDWWFTDQAVVIDTAGRFTTQDSDREGNHATWSGFLAMLKRSRPRQPVNGVLVTVGVDLLVKGLAERTDYATKVRHRMQELQQSLGIRFPVYVLVTKSDLMAGFMDYFATLDKEQRATPWGTTFPLDGGTGGQLKRFGPEFDALAKRLYDGLVTRLRGETDPQRRARIYGFPSQFARLQTALQEFLDVVFTSTRFDAEPLLRGVYFISGTQEGTPIDRVLGSAARAFRLDSMAIVPNQSSGRSYFLSRLLGEVVFAESGLAGTDRKREQRLRWATGGAYALIGLLTVGTLAAWSISYLNNRRYVQDVAQRVDAVRKTVLAAPQREAPELQPLLPALSATRDLARDAAAAGTGTLGWGLEQVNKLDNAARAAYERMLVDAVLPRLSLRVEEQLREAGASGQGQYEALKTYIMLHDADHFEEPALKAHFEADWDNQLGRNLDAGERAALGEHLAALLDQGRAVSALPADKALIDFHRNRLASTSLPQRIYERMRQQGLGANFPEFTIANAAGDKAGLVFTRASGQPLTRGVPGLFSYDGYHKGFQGEVTRVTKQLASEQPWVLGATDAPKDAAAVVRAEGPLVDAVRRLYLNEYVLVWDTFIADIRLQPMTTMGQSIQMAQLLSSASGPLPQLLRAMSRQTTLSAPDGKNLVDKAGDGAKKVFESTREAIAGTLGGNKAGALPEAAVERIVDDRFANLRRMITAPPGGGKAPLDDTIALIAEVQGLLITVDNAVKAKTTPPPSPVPAKVKMAAGDLPQPLRAMLEELSGSSGSAVRIIVRQNLAGEVRAQIGEFCQQAIAGRYPLDRSSTRDARPDDFASLFAPGGKFDTVFQQKLAPFVDTAARPSWRFLDGEAGPLGKDSGTLPQFQRAQAIRETFFPAGNVPTMRLQFKPVEMDTTITSFVLDVDGTIVRWDHGPQIPVQVPWPGPRGGTQVRLQLSPPQASSASGLVFDGPWALFKLFDRVRIEPGGSPEKFRASFNVDGRKAVFEVIASSVRNPFQMSELKDFSCPTGL